MVTRIHRFDFNTLRDFRGPIVVNTLDSILENEELAPPPPPVFTQADLDAARLSAKREGYTEGFAAGKTEAQAEADQQLMRSNDTIVQLGTNISDLRNRYTHMIAQESSQLSQLISSIARKVAGEAMDARGEEEIFAIVTRCLPVIFSKPKLVIDMHPDIFERTLERIENLFREHGIEAEIQFRSNPGLGISDVTIDWGSGQINRSAENLWQEIDGLIARMPLEVALDETNPIHKNQ